MTKTIALAAICLALTSCATPLAPARPAEIPAAVALDPRLCVDLPVEPGLPDAAGMPRPATAIERAAALVLTLWIQDLLAYARSLEARADLARAECLADPPAAE